MRLAFGFHTLSLTIDSTLEEYRKSAGLDSGASLLRLSIPDIVVGDRSKCLVFRHEHTASRRSPPRGLPISRHVLGLADRDAVPGIAPGIA
jgi:hypothetical protein